LFDGVALLWIEAAQLVFGGNAELLTHFEQFFALHVQHFGQGINTYFFFLLQAQLLLCT
jgi:hypothetical protein